MSTFISNKQFAHYYGDIVRVLFLTASVIMLIGLPIVSNYLNLPTIFSVIGILILVLSAGITNPKQLWHAGINCGIAAVGIAVFESYAVTAFRSFGPMDKFFLSNLALGFIFLFAGYFSVKTFRGLLLQSS